MATWRAIRTVNHPSQLDAALWHLNHMAAEKLVEELEPGKTYGVRINRGCEDLGVGQQRLSIDLDVFPVNCEPYHLRILPKAEPITSFSTTRVAKSACRELIDRAKRKLQFWK